LLKIKDHTRKWWIFIAMTAALSVVFLDQSAISVILPAVQNSFAMSNVMLQWVINAYLLTIAAIVVFAGKMGDVFGHKRIFLIGLCLFIIFSFACGASQSGVFLVISRAFQGIGGAFMIPVTGVMIAHAFPESERGKIMGLYIAAASVFLSVGPVISGTLVHYFNWRWVFWINLPISFFSLLLARIAVPARENHKTSRKPLDWMGFISFTIFITSLTVALMEGTSLGFASTEIIFLFLTAIVFAILFIAIEKKAKDPIIDLSLFTRRTFLSSNLCLLLFTCAFSCSVFWAIFLQKVQGYSAVDTGLFYLPVTLPIMFMAPFGGRLRDKYGPRLPTICGLLLVIFGTFWIASTAFLGSYWAMFPGFLFYGLGPSLIYSSVMATTISSVPLAQMGMASGIANGIRQLGRVLGVAILGAVMVGAEHMTMPHIKSMPTFAFSMSMVFSGFFVIMALIVGFLLPNHPLSPRLNKSAQLPSISEN